MNRGIQRILLTDIQFRVYHMRTRRAMTFREIGAEVGRTRERCGKLNSEVEAMLDALTIHLGVRPTIEQLERLVYATTKPSTRTIQRRRRIRRMATQTA